jgi:hypothetical protein
VLLENLRKPVEYITSDLVYCDSSSGVLCPFHKITIVPVILPKDEPTGQCGRSNSVYLILLVSITLNIFMLKRMVQGTLPEAFDKVTDPEVKDVISKCLHKDPADR